MYKPKTVREILEYLYAKGLDLSDTATVEEINVDCKEQVDLAEAALNAIYSPLSVEETREPLEKMINYVQKQYDNPKHTISIYLPHLEQAKLALSKLRINGEGVSDAKFISHIQSHLSFGQEVICKICGKTAREICG
jgi:hypothetical protein